MLLPRMSPFVFVGPCRKVAVRILVKKRTDARRSNCTEDVSLWSPIEEVDLPLHKVV